MDQVQKRYQQLCNFTYFKLYGINPGKLPKMYTLTGINFENICKKYMLPNKASSGVKMLRYGIIQTDTKY